MESRPSFFRKRTVPVIALLLLLSALIGIEKLVRHEGGRAPEAEMEQRVTVSPCARTKPKEGSESVVSSPAGDQSLSQQADEEPSAEDGDPGQVRRDGGGGAPARLASQIYFIRGHSLLTSRVEGLSRASAIEMLEEAVSLVTASLPEGNLVFDAEGLATSRGRFVVYAKPGYDLTDEVAVVFDQLKLQQRRQSAASHPGK